MTHQRPNLRPRTRSKASVSSQLLVRSLGIAWVATQTSITAAQPAFPPSTGALSPEQEAATFQFADPELAVELAAAEPDVLSPVSITWDAEGRMFVAEMNDYPLGPGRGQVRVLDERDRSGRYRRARVLARGLPFPNSVLPWNGGVLVTAAPNLWFFKDTNGDGEADERRVLFTGFGEGNQQLRANGLFWGLDGWVYGANGRSDGEVRRPNEPSSKAVSLRGHDFRFRPDTGEFEVLAGRSQFGATRDDFGERFLSWNIIPIRHVVIEERELNRNPRFALSDSIQDLIPPSDTREVFPLTPAPLVFNEESSSHFNALAGLAIFRGDSLSHDPSGRSYSGNAFAGESLRNLVHRRVLVADGPTYRAERGEHRQEFLAATDPWFHPVNFATGPDGNLYIVDFYRRFVEHPNYVHDRSVVDKVPWREGEGHGRIWRVKRKRHSAIDELTAPLPKFANASAEMLVQSLSSPNGWRRDTAHRLLLERQDRSAAPLLSRLLSSSDAPRPIAAVHALWLLDGLSALDTSILTAASSHPAPAVRATAAQLAQSRVSASPEVQKALCQAAKDTGPGVQLKVALALGNWTNSLAHDKAAALARLAKLDSLNLWLARAILSSVGPEPERFWTALLESDRRWLDVPSQPAALMIRTLGLLSAGQTNVVQLLDAAAPSGAATDSKTPAQIVFFAGVLDGIARSRPDLGPATRLSQDIVQPLVRTALPLACSSAAPEFLRVAAILVLGQAAPTDANPALLALLRAAEPTGIKRAAAQTIAWRNDAPLASAAFRAWEQHPRDARQALLSVTPSSPALAAALMDQLETRVIALLEVDPATRDALLRGGSPALRQRAQHLLAAQASTDRDAVIQRYRPALNAEGNPAKGAAVFNQLCIVCHAINGRGSNVGPDLSAIGTRPRESLLIDILDPSRSVPPESLSYTVETTDDRSVTGLIVSESASHVTLRRSQQPDDTIPRSGIRQIRAEGKSLMPDGLEQGTTPEQIADLLAFLRRPNVTLLATP